MNAVLFRWHPPARLFPHQLNRTVYFGSDEGSLLPSGDDKADVADHRVITSHSVCLRSYVGVVFREEWASQQPNIIQPGGR